MLPGMLLHLNDTYTPSYKKLKTLVSRSQNRIYIGKGYPSRKNLLFLSAAEKSSFRFNLC